MKRSQRSSRSLVIALLAGSANLAGVCSLAMAHPGTAGDRSPRSCSTPEEALRRYVNAVNAGDFDAQYALFAPVEHEGPKPAPIPLLPKRDLQRLVTHLIPPFPAGIRIGTNLLHTYMNSAGGKPDGVGGFLVPIVAPGKPAAPRGPYTASYAIFLQATPDGWKVRAWATYWMYFQRAYGTGAGTRFREAYRRESERLGLLRKWKATAAAG
jgi:hypothetical protein